MRSSGLVRSHIVCAQVCGQFSGEVGLDTCSSQIDGFLPCLGIIGIAQAVDVDLRVRIFSTRNNGIFEVVGVEGAAAALVSDGESVVLDSGTTTLFVARELRARRNVVVFTFSLSVLEEFTSAEGIRVELTGGVYRSTSHDLIGHAVTKSLTSIYADTVIFGAAAISFTRGVMVHDPDAQHELLQAGKRKILVVDSSKIGREATYRLCGIEDCDLILTDQGVSNDDLARLRRMTEVRVAG